GFGVLRFADDTGLLDVCGDGVRDPGERCDDGNTDDGDCCTTDCQTAAPNGTRCDDANACTVDRSRSVDVRARDPCRDGVCTGGGRPPCEPCGTCDPDLGCVWRPSDLCRAPTATERAVLEMRRGRSRRDDALSWLWGSGEATAKSDFGDPRAASGYALCVYVGG